ncbi:hypothetical protein SSX86_010834 [Deinandra increscens subsp. villosa]|uniref:Pre-mRNA polyadenylation factor Fip1 domain-containing protein n=1 Tax=Deinandra increscens subsp. villosa TaxID=3103831 RepID=A0AAP0DCS1_9ASTR
MEDGDDDFGDLYADVEVEANSAINVAPQFSQAQCHRDEIGKQDGDNDKVCVDVDIDEDDDDDDDDDDDLDIVLNSDDDSARQGDGFTIARNSTNLRSRELEDEDDGAEEFVVGNSRSLYKYLRSQPAAFGSDLKGIRCMKAAYLSREDGAYWQQMGSRSMGPQSAQRFSLPRARNILDVNIDVFEHKPWKHPGADLTDYFNFGFDEDSWKLYCNQVDEYRHRRSVSRGTPPPESEPAQSIQVDKVYKNQKLSQMKGQAIQVEDSIFERQSSMDIRRQLNRDSDVIQVLIILDPEDTSVPEESNHGDVSGDDVTDHISFSSASEEESVEWNCAETDMQPPKMRSGSENHEIHQVLTIKNIRTSNDMKESIFVAESSEAGKSPANHSKSFEDDACIDRRKVYTHDRCLTELTRSVKPDYHHSDDLNKSDDKRAPDENRYHARRLGGDRKHGDRIYHKRCNNRAYNNGTHKDFNLKSHHENEYIISRRMDDKRKSGEHRSHVRHNHGFFAMSDEGHSTFRQRLHAFDPYNKENVSYTKSEVPSDYYGERFCGYEDWDTEKFGANMDRTDFRSSEEDEYYDEQNRYFEDNRMMAGDWCHNEKGQKKGANRYFRNKGEIDEFNAEPGNYDDIHGEKFGHFTYNDRQRNDAEYRWEFRGAGRNKRACSVSSELDNPLLKRDNEQSFGSQSPEESHINNYRWHGNMMPKNSFYRRDESYEGQYFEPFDREDYMIYMNGHVDMRRRRCHWQSEIQREDEVMFRHEDAKVYAHRNSFPFEKASRGKRFVSEPDKVEGLIDDPYVVDSELVDGSGYIKKLTDDQHANGFRYYKQKNDVFSGNKCVETHGKSRARLPLSSRKSHSVVGEVKSSGKHKKRKKMYPHTCSDDKNAQADERKAINEGLDIEEGQIVTEEVEVGPTLAKPRAHINRPGNQNGKPEFDNTRILEAMARMEKRRTRFNEPIPITRNDTDSLIKLTVDLIQETATNKQQRPARKRRWGGS